MLNLTYAVMTAHKTAKQVAELDRQLSGEAPPPTSDAAVNAAGIAALRDVARLPRAVRGGRSRSSR